jgi:hypothetical protein
MKRIFILASVLLLASVSYGQTPEPPKPTKTTIKEQLDAMQKESRPLFAIRAANKKILEALNQTKIEIDTAAKPDQAKLEKYNADVTAYNAQNDANEAKIASLYEKWKVAVAPLQDCLKAGGVTRYATSDQIQKACGEAYDGIPVEKPKP